MFYDLSSSTAQTLFKAESPEVPYNSSTKVKSPEGPLNIYTHTHKYKQIKSLSARSTEFSQ